jgi:hypothetical protein
LRVLLLLLLGLVVGVVLPELLLRGGNQAEIMFGVLIKVFGCDRVTGTLRIAGKLEILFRNVGCGAANLHLGSIGLVHSRKGILVMVMSTTATAATTAAATLAISTPHALVLTVSHGLAVANLSF